MLDCLTLVRPARGATAVPGWLGGRLVSGMLLPILAVGVGAGCAEIVKTAPEDANKLAELRADLEQDAALIEYQKVRKKEVAKEGKDPDSLDNAEPLRAEPRFAERWRQQRQAKFEASKESYKALSADIVNKCTMSARNGASAGDIDTCVRGTPQPVYDPLKTVGIGALVLVLGVAGVGLYRSARRRIDPVVQASQKLGLAPIQSATTTTLTGEYKGFAVKIEASAPEVGQGDGFLRAIVLSKVDPHTVVRFGPLAPPTGLDLPDLDAPEVHDGRLPEGYKLRLSAGADAEALLSGDVGFQLRAFDPVDVRIHDGMVGLTCWQVPGNVEKVIEFVDIAISVAKLYPPA